MEYIVKRNFQNVYQFTWDKKNFLKPCYFNGWNLWGNIAAKLLIIDKYFLNIFFSVQLLAARGITIL
jgi:hypothetical protein